jgi:hypothetical protein
MDERRHAKGRPEERPLAKVRLGSEPGIDWRGGTSPRLPVSPVPGLDSAGRPTPDHAAVAALVRIAGGTRRRPAAT